MRASFPLLLLLGAGRALIGHASCSKGRRRLWGKLMCSEGHYVDSDRNCQLCPDRQYQNECSYENDPLDGFKHHSSNAQAYCRGD